MRDLTGSPAAGSGSPWARTTLATYPPGTGYLRGEFTAPSTPRPYEVIATGASTTWPGCYEQAAPFWVWAPPTLSVSLTAATPGENIDYAATMKPCGEVTVRLGASLIATAYSGRFAAPSTLGAYTLTATANSPDDNPVLCSASAHFEVVAATTSTTSGEPQTGPSAPEAGRAPISATPLHVTG